MTIELPHITGLILRMWFSPVPMNREQRRTKNRLLDFVEPLRKACNDEADGLRVEFADRDDKNEPIIKMQQGDSKTYQTSAENELKINIEFGKFINTNGKLELTDTAKTDLVAWADLLENTDLVLSDPDDILLNNIVKMLRTASKPTEQTTTV